MSSASSKRNAKTKKLMKILEMGEFNGKAVSTFEKDLSIEVGEVDLSEVERIATNQLKLVLPSLERGLANALDAAISSPSWQWFDGSRDIVDTGELKNALNISWNGLKLIVAYDTPYAMLVHEGGYIRPYGNPNATPVYLPGRPWVRSVLLGGGPVPQFDWELAIKNAL